MINNKANTQLLLNYLESIISDTMIYESFIKGISIVEEGDTEIVIEVPTKPVFLILTRDYLGVIRKAVKEIYERQVDVVLVIQGEYVSEVGTNKVVRSAGIINSNLLDKYTFDNYVEAKFNKQALKAAKQIVKEPMVFSPFFVYSNSGLGKTHLLHAIGNEVIKKGKKALYVNPDKITYIITTAMKESQESLNKIVEEIGNYDYLLFDDIQNLGDRSKTLSVLFNIINTANEKGVQIVITADKTPNELGGFEDRFITRFEKGLTLEIKSPDIDDLVQILKYKLDEEDLRSNTWEDKALKFIARNYSQSIRSIEGAVKRVKFFSLDDQSLRYTYSVITKIFDQLKINKEELTPQRIITVVSHYYKISTGDILSKTRKQEVVLARHIAMWLIRSINRLSFKQIGKIFSRDHSTIMSAVTNVDRAMKINSAIKLAVKQIESKISVVN